MTASAWLCGEPALGACSLGRGEVAVSLSQGGIACYDAATNSLTRSWPLPPGRELTAAAVRHAPSRCLLAGLTSSAGSSAELLAVRLDAEGDAVRIIPVSGAAKGASVARLVPLAEGTRGGSGSGSAALAVLSDGSVATTTSSAASEVARPHTALSRVLAGSVTGSLATIVGLPRGGVTGAPLSVARYELPEDVSAAPIALPALSLRLPSRPVAPTAATIAAGDLAVLLDDATVLLWTLPAASDADPTRPLEPRVTRRCAPLRGSPEAGTSASSGAATNPATPSRKGGRKGAKRGAPEQPTAGTGSGALADLGGGLFIAIAPSSGRQAAPSSLLFDWSFGVPAPGPDLEGIAATLEGPSAAPSVSRLGRGRLAVCSSRGVSLAAVPGSAPSLAARLSGLDAATAAHGASAASEVAAAAADLGRLELGERVRPTDPDNRVAAGEGAPAAPDADGLPAIVKAPAPHHQPLPKRTPVGKFAALAPESRASYAASRFGGSLVVGLNVGGLEGEDGPARAPAPSSPWAFDLADLSSQGELLEAIEGAFGTAGEATGPPPTATKAAAILEVAAVKGWWEAAEALTTPGRPLPRGLLAAAPRFPAAAARAGRLSTLASLLTTGSAADLPASGLRELIAVLMAERRPEPLAVASRDLAKAARARASRAVFEAERTNGSVARAQLAARRAEGFSARQIAAHCVFATPFDEASLREAARGLRPHQALLALRYLAAWLEGQSAVGGDAGPDDAYARRALARAASAAGPPGAETPRRTRSKGARRGTEDAGDAPAPTPALLLVAFPGERDVLRWASALLDAHFVALSLDDAAAPTLRRIRDATDARLASLSGLAALSGVLLQVARRASSTPAGIPTAAPARPRKGYALRWLDLSVRA